MDVLEPPRLGGLWRVTTNDDSFQGTFTEFDPPRVITFGTHQGSMSFHLYNEHDRAGCRLEFTLDRPAMGGWHPGTLCSFHQMLLDGLRSHLSDVPPEEVAKNYKHNWRQYRRTYEREVSEAIRKLPTAFISTRNQCSGIPSPLASSPL